MKIDVKRLREAVGLVQLVTKSGTYSYPVLGHVLLKVEDNRLTVGGTDLDAWITVTSQSPLDDGEDMAISVPAKLFSDYLNTIEGELVSMSVEEKKATLTIESDRDVATVKGMLGDEFPELPEAVDEEEEEGLHLTQATLLSIADRVAFAAATDKTRPILTGVFLTANGTELKAVGADGYRLSELSQSQDWESEKMSVLIPARTFPILTKICKAYPESVVKMTLSKTRALFEVGGVLLWTNLIEGDPPDYGGLIPIKWNTKVTLDPDGVKKLWQAVKALGLFTHILKVDILLGGKIQLSAVSLEGGSGETEVVCEAEGESLTFGISVKYLAEALHACKGRSLEIWLTDEVQPVLLAQDSFRHVIMPMRIG